MKKVLSILLAVLMVASMFSVVAFAEEVTEETEKKPVTFYVGGVNGRQTKPGGSNGRSEAKAFAFTCFDPEGKGGAQVIPFINDQVESGEYSEVVIVVAGAATSAVKFAGLVGTEETPIIVRAKTGDAVVTPVFESEKLDNVAPAILVEDCEYVTFEKIGAKTSLYNGIEVRDCSNVAFKNVEFKDVGYTDYSLPVSTDAETGEETFPNMDTSDILVKGSALLIGAGNTNVTVDACKFENCRAGVVVDSAEPVVEEEEENAPEAAAEEGAEGEDAAPVETSGVEILNCTFNKIGESAVILNGAKNVLVSGGAASAVGGIVNAEDFDGTATTAVVALNGAVNATVERIYSSFNEVFVDSIDSTGRIRYNVSDNDLASYVLDDVLVYNNTFVNASGLLLDTTAKNNIFSMVIGEKVVVGEGEANCYHWTSKGDRNSIKKNPWFANAFDGSVDGQPVSDNYILAAGSPCIGEGVKVEDDMGTTDFYGNEIGSSFNIGADQGAGAEATTELVSQFADSFNYFIALIKNFFANLFG